MQEIYSIIGVTLRVCLLSTLIASIIAIVFAFVLGINNSKIANFFKTIITAFTGLPPVIAGVLVYLLFSRNGIFGDFNWIYTERVIIIAQVIIVIPIIISNIYPVVENIRLDYLLTCKGLNMSKTKVYYQLLKEIKYSVITSLVVGFGRAISEVGSVMIVGGNIRYKTRVLTSAIVLENNKGNYDMSIKLGLILMTISFFVSFIAIYFSRRADDKIKKYPGKNTW